MNDLEFKKPGDGIKAYNYKNIIGLKLKKKHFLLDINLKIIILKNEKKICAYIGSRANYASIKSVLSAIKQSKKLRLQIILAASGVLDKYGNLEKLIIQDGFKID